MRAAVFEGAGRLVTRDWPRPGIGPGELLLRVRGCGLCGSDIAKIVAPDTRAPAVFGHEVVGDVVEAGRGVAHVGVGDRVVAAHHVPCGECHYCVRGSHSMCRSFKATNLDPGGFAEYVRVPGPNVRHATFRVPPEMSDETASFVEPLACCLRAVDRAAPEPGDSAVVVGLGSIGVLLVQALRRRSVSVIGADPLPTRAALGRRFGAAAAGGADEVAAAVRQVSRGRGVDHVLVTAGGADVLPWAVGLVRDGGALHYFAGGPGDALPLPLGVLYHRELTLTATYSSSPFTLARSFELLVAGDVRVDGLVTHHLPLERLDAAVELMRRREALKVFVTP